MRSRFKPYLSDWLARKYLEGWWVIPFIIFILYAGLYELR